MRMGYHYVGRDWDDVLTADVATLSLYVSAYDLIKEWSCTLIYTIRHIGELVEHLVASV
jgi:hypothetical protein